jgi:hypothetical protein
MGILCQQPKLIKRVDELSRIGCSEFPDDVLGACYPGIAALQRIEGGVMYTGCGDDVLLILQ